MSALRTYIRELLKEEGELQIRVLRAMDQLSKASDVVGRETEFFSDAVKGMGALKAASSSFRRAKTGRVSAAYDATKGSRKNVIKAIAGLGVIGAIVTQGVRDGNAEKPISEEEKEKLTAAFVDFHEGIVKILNNRTNVNVRAIRTPSILENEDGMTTEIANTSYPGCVQNFDKYVNEYSSTPIIGDTSYDRMYTLNSELRTTKTEITSLVGETKRKADQFDESGLKFYAACVMYVHYGELIAAGLDADCDLVNTISTEESQSIVAKYNKYRKDKKAQMEGPTPVATLRAAQQEIDSVQ